MTRQQLQIALPWAVPAGTVTVDWHTDPDDSFSLPTATRYNDRQFSSASNNVGAYLKDALLGGASGVWGISERSGYLGRYRLQVVHTDYVTDLTLPTGLGAILGFTSDTITPTSVTGPFGGNYLTIFDAPNRARGLFIPEPAAECYLDPDDWRDVQTVVAAQSPSGASTIDLYGTLRRRRVTITAIGAFSARASYRAANYGATYGLSFSTDPNVTWEEFVALWRAQASPLATAQQGSARLALDVVDTSVYVTVYLDALAAYVADPAAALSLFSEAPLLYVLDFELLEAT